MATKKNQVLVPDHIYVPKHEIMSKQEAEEVLKSSRLFVNKIKSFLDLF